LSVKEDGRKPEKKRQEGSLQRTFLKREYRGDARISFGMGGEKGKFLQDARRGTTHKLKRKGVK